MNRQFSLEYSEICLMWSRLLLSADYWDQIAKDSLLKITN